MTDIQPYDIGGASWRWGLSEDGRPFAVATDMAKSFDHATAKDLIRGLDEDEKGRQIVPTPGGPQEMWVVYEDGIWELIFLSRKAEAKALKKKVKDILRMLRTGELKVAEPKLNELEVARKYVAALEANLVLEAENTVLKPKAELADQFLTSDGTVYLNDIAKNLGITQPELTKVLRARGVLYKKQFLYMHGYESWFRVAQEWNKHKREWVRALKVTRVGVQGIYALFSTLEIEGDAA